MASPHQASQFSPWVSRPDFQTFELCLEPVKASNSQGPSIPESHWRMGSYIIPYNSLFLSFLSIFPTPDITHTAATLLTHASLYTYHSTLLCLSSNHLPPFLFNHQTNNLPIQPSLYTTSQTTITAMSNYSYSSSSSKYPVTVSYGSSSSDSTYHESHAGRHYSSANSSMSYEPSREQRYRVPDHDNSLSPLTRSSPY